MQGGRRGGLREADKAAGLVGCGSFTQQGQNAWRKVRRAGDMRLVPLLPGGGCEDTGG